MPVVLVFSITLFALGYKKVNSNFQSVAFGFLIIFFLLFLSGLRFETGRDYIAYSDQYRKINGFFTSDHDNFHSADGFEKGFVVLERIIKTFSQKPYIMFFIVSTITLSLIIYEFHKFGILFFLCLLGFLSKTFFYTNLSVIRQGLAIAISISSFRKLTQDSNKIKYIFIILFASLFHQTAILFLFFVIFPTKKKTFFFFLLFGFFICIINYDGTFFLNRVMKLISNYSKYSVYIKVLTEKANVFKLRSLYPRIIVALFFLFSTDKSSENKFVCLLSWINITAIIFTAFFHEFGEIFNRIMIYFELPFILLLAMFVSFKSKISKKFRYLFVIGYYIFSFINIYKVWWSDLNPYKTILGISL
jgi:hypothetical protein